MGFSRDNGDVTPGANVVSAPLFAYPYKIIGCLILIGTFQESMIEKYGLKVVQLAKQISSKLGANMERVYPVRFVYILKFITPQKGEIEN